MATEIRIRRAARADAGNAADFAAAKRAEYERYSPVFWRRAADDRARHEPFLAACIESGDFASFVAERGADTVGIVLADRRGGPPPFADESEPSWLVDDFFVADPALWDSAGRALLDWVADEATADGAARLICVCARRDTAKRSFLLGAGCDTAAFWWVQALTPAGAPAQEPAGATAVIRPAPPVYDPGGPVALARSPLEAGAVTAFTAWAAAAGAVLAIVPARSSDTPLANALEAAGYDAASKWFVRQL